MSCADVQATPEDADPPDRLPHAAAIRPSQHLGPWWKQPVRPWMTVVATLVACLAIFAALQVVWLSQWSGQSRGYSPERALSPLEEGSPLVLGPTVLVNGLRSAAHGPNPAELVAQWLAPERATWAPSLGVTGTQVTWEGIPSDNEVPATDRSQLLAAYQPSRDVIHMRADLDPVLGQQVLLHEMIHRLQYQVGPDMASWWEVLDPSLPTAGLYAASHPREHQAEAGSLAWGWLVWCREHPRAAIRQISQLEDDVPGVRAWGELWLTLSQPLPGRDALGATEHPTTTADLPGPACVEVLRAGLSAEHVKATHEMARIIQQYDRTVVDRRPLWRHLRGILTVRQPGDRPWRWLLAAIGEDAARRLPPPVRP